MKVKRHGFTLLELLVAAALMALLVGAALGLAAGILRHWTREVENSRLEMQANFIFDRLGMDLAGAIHPHGRTSAGVSVVPGATGAGRGMLRFLSDSAGSPDSAGSTRAVAWLCQVDPASSPFIDDTVPSLFRFTLSPEATAAESLKTDDGFDWQWMKETDPEPAFMAAGCLEFEIELLVRDSDGRLVSAPAPEVELLNNPDEEAAHRPDPVAARIALRMLPESKFAAYAAWIAEPTADRTAQWEHQHTRTFTRTLPLRVDPRQ